ncbi:hypothetical protein EHQ05_15165 [Leptospira yasudae]|uniref:Phage tail protein n=1 Tax=Leptospira yasudae TaxID=2202201 RepID=A0ABX9M4K2_9LEPT|nr:hypothetical protein [Leptospira yasudae]RHX80661.1 hypothetical protein DLM77_07180 [Leptospira yasudae]TGK24270.1 hypothetical protein EHQ05_15165 [Leptospira yasudae]TGM00882.1 hypothetical protein EHQ86_20070 [Leptospira yasudae]
MAVFNPTKTRTWNKSTPADGDLIDEEVDRQYENDQYLKDRIDQLEVNFTAIQVPLGGIIEDSLNIAAVSNFKEANAQAISRTTFSALWDLVRKTVTGIVPSTDRINSTNHGCIEGQLVKFSFTGGGVTALTKYYVRNPTLNDFQISATPTGSIIDLTSSQTGEVIVNVEYGFGDGSTTYNLPDRRGIFGRGAGVHGTRAKAAGGNYDAGVVGTEGQDQYQGHWIRVYRNTDNGGGTDGTPLQSDFNNSGLSDSSTVGTAINHVSDGTNGTPRTGNETTPAYVAVRYKVRVA